jgi:hypothetical protein
MTKSKEKKMEREKCLYRAVGKKKPEILKTKIFFGV